MLLSFIMLTVFGATMLVTVYKDATTMTIPNWVSLLVLGSFFVLLPFVWQGGANFGEHMASGLILFVLGFFLFAMGWLGGGDAKLMAAIAVWWTFPDLLVFVGYTTVAGGILGIFVLAGRKYVPAQIITLPWMHKMFREETHIPYGLALAVGALATLPQSDIFLYAASLG